MLLHSKLPTAQWASRRQQAVLCPASRGISSRRVPAPLAAASAGRALEEDYYLRKGEAGDKAVIEELIRKEWCALGLGWGSLPALGRCKLRSRVVKQRTHQVFRPAKPQKLAFGVNKPMLACHVLKARPLNPMRNPTWTFTATPCTTRRPRGPSLICFAHCIACHHHCRMNPLGLTPERFTVAVADPERPSDSALRQGTGMKTADGNEILGFGQVGHMGLTHMHQLLLAWRHGRALRGGGQSGTFATGAGRESALGKACCAFTHGRSMAAAGWHDRGWAADS